MAEAQAAGAGQAQQGAPQAAPEEEESQIDTHSLEFIHDVNLGIAVELGRKDLPIQRLQQLKKGSVIEMEKLSEEPLDIRVNGKLVARGEAVIVNEMFGIRVTQIMAPEGEEGLQ